jgi:hypothetical protein
MDGFRYGIDWFGWIFFSMRTDLRRVQCGDMGMEIGWFPMPLLRQNISDFDSGKWTSPAEAIAHEMGHASVVGVLMATLGKRPIANQTVSNFYNLSDATACSTQKAVHEELFGGPSTGAPDTYTGCLHSTVKW